MKILQKKSWFSMIEILVAILIFSLWLTAVYALIASSQKLNNYNRNFIIASNLAREQIELIKSIRDSNFATIHKWSQINPKWSFTNTGSDFFLPERYYILENDYSSAADFPIKVEQITDFWEWQNVLSSKMQQYRLCLDTKMRYTYDCTGNIPTHFYRYVKFEPVMYKSWSTDVTVEGAMKIISKVIWYQWGYNETDITTLLTDWKRL